MPVNRIQCRSCDLKACQERSSMLANCASPIAGVCRPGVIHLRIWSEIVGVCVIQWLFLGKIIR